MFLSSVLYFFLHYLRCLFSSFPSLCAITPTLWYWLHLLTALSNTFPTNMTAAEPALFTSSLLSLPASTASEQNITLSDTNQLETQCRVHKEPQHILILASRVTAQEQKTASESSVTSCPSQHRLQWTMWSISTFLLWKEGIRERQKEEIWKLWGDWWGHV